MSITLKEYQEQSATHAFYPDRGMNMTYPILGLVGESGECAEKLKKFLRDKPNPTAADTQEFKQGMKLELGDVLWYCARVAEECGFTLQDVALANVEKLNSRAKRGTLGGSGDDR